MIYRQLFGVPSFRYGSPFNELDLLKRQMDRLVDTFSGESLKGRTAGVFPLVNLTEDKDHYYLYAEIPGIEAGALKIEAERSTISISGERKIHEAGSNVRYHRREREAGTFSRVVGLPGEIDADKVVAALRNGILRVTVPKAETAKPKQIVVQ
jgi:HSP20 family protein